MFSFNIKHLPIFLFRYPDLQHAEVNINVCLFYQLSGESLQTHEREILGLNPGDRREFVVRPKVQVM
jgi:hypothetical protein